MTSGKQLNCLVNRFVYMSVIKIVCIILFNSSLHCYAQKYYMCETGLVFTKDYTPPIVLTDKGISSFTPEITEIAFAEKILQDRYNLDLSSDPRFTSFKTIVDIKSYFKSFKRQYLGYFNKKNEKIIIIHMLNFSKCKQAQKKFVGWELEYFVGFGEFYEKNIQTFSVNLDTRKMALF